MLAFVWKLIRARWRITFNNIWRAGPRRKIGLAFAALGLTVFAVFLVVVSWGFLSLIRQPRLAGLIPPDFERTVPVLFTAATFLAGLLTNFGVLLQSLYLAGDMEFLLATPVPPRAVFVAKLIQAVLPNFLFMCLFNLPALVGLGIAQHYTPAYFVMLPVMLVLLMLCGAGIAGVAVMVIVRAVPARRVAEVLGMVGGVATILCSQSGQLTRVAGVGRAGTAQMMALAAAASRLDNPLSPLAWPGRALVALGEARWPAAALLVGLVLALAGGAFAVSLALAERLYVSGWAQTRSGAGVRRVARAERRGASRARQLLPRALSALVIKDLKLLRRDLRNLSQLITPIIIGVVYTVSLVRDAGAPRRGLDSIEALVVAYLGLGTALFVAWMFAARLALGGIGMEGKQYWLLKVSPLRAETLLAAKFLVAFAPSLVVGVLFLVASTALQGAGFDALGYNLLALMATVAALCAVYLAAGTVGVNLAWEDPRHTTRGLTGCLSWIAGSLVMSVFAGVFIGVPVVLGLAGAPRALAQTAGIALGLVLCFGTGAGALLWARSRVARVGE